ncbi:hypothetical protein GCM10009773_26310 [Williamsia serinedens]
MTDDAQFAARFVRVLEDRHLVAGRGEAHGCGESSDPGPHDDDARHPLFTTPSMVPSMARSSDVSRMPDYG